MAAEKPTEPNDNTTKSTEVQILQYPLDTTNSRSKVVFHVKKINAPSLKGIDFEAIFASMVSLNRPSKDDGDGKPKNEDEAGVVDAMNEAGSGAGNNTKQVTARSISDPISKISLYLPVSLVITDNFGYDTPSLGVAGAAGYQALSAGTGAMGALGQAIVSGKQSITDMVNSAKTPALARLALARGAQKLNETAGAVASIAGAVSVNPNLRTQFRNVGIREFQFQFKFIPKSKKEADEIKNIINVFRKSAYPELIGGAGEGLSAGYKYPMVFDVSSWFMPAAGKEGAKAVRVGTKLKNTFIRSISVNYNAGSMAFHEDGTPAEIDLSFTMVEDRTLSREDVEFSTDDDETGGY